MKTLLTEARCIVGATLVIKPLIIELLWSHSYAEHKRSIYCVCNPNIPIIVNIPVIQLLVTAQSSCHCLVLLKSISLCIIFHVFARSSQSKMNFASTILMQLQYACFLGTSVTVSRI